MTIRTFASCAAGASCLLGASARAATWFNPAEQDWLIPALAALCVSLLLLAAVLLRRRRAKVDSAIVAAAKERSLQRHTERQRIATQFADADF